MKIKVVFVCLGNICRSPVAEGVFKEMVENKGYSSLFEIDSAGTGAYHVGELPDSRMRETAFSHGIKLVSRARKFEKKDLDYYDYIVVMDKSNFRNVLSLSDKAHSNVHLMRDFDPLPEDGEVPDPYYGGITGFKNVFQIVSRSCDVLLQEILKTQKL